jgi:starvation-inducible DNA-binding protein
MQDVRELADKAQDMKDPGTNDMLISNVLRTNELQTWFISEHLVEMPLVIAQ